MSDKRIILKDVRLMKDVDPTFRRGRKITVHTMAHSILAPDANWTVGANAVFGEQFLVTDDYYIIPRANCTAALSSKEHSSPLFIAEERDGSNILLQEIFDNEATRRTPICVAQESIHDYENLLLGKGSTVILERIGIDGPFFLIRSCRGTGS